MRAPDGSRPVVLVVDDDRDLRWLLQRVLEQEGFSVVPHATGKAALVSLRRRRPALLLLAMTLPDMSGLRVVRGARRAHPGIPIIVISATVNEGLVQECLRLGVLAYLPKPFDVKEVLRLVRGAVVPGS